MANPILSVCIAIDNENSTYAFLFQHNYAFEKSVHVSSHLWNKQKLKPVTPTTILLDPKKTFHSFGYKAENKYSELQEEDEHKDWYYFPRFAAAIYDHNGSYEDLNVRDIRGKKVTASTLLAHAIRYMKDRVLQKFKSLCANVGIEDTQWVLTIPNASIYDTKEFIRKAAKEAGLGDNVLMIRDHTAVTLCTIHLTEKDWYRPGQKYLVLDWKQHRFEATVNELLKPDSLREISHTIYRNLGICRIAEDIYEILAHILGVEVIEEFRNKCQLEYSCFMQDIVEYVATNSDMKSKVSMKIPITVQKLYEEKKDEEVNTAIRRSRYSGKIEMIRDKIQFTKEFFSALLLKVIDDICDGIVQILKQPTCEGTDLFILVGTNNTIFVNRLKERFTDNTVILSRYDDMSAVIGGAIFTYYNLKLKALLSLQEDFINSFDDWKEFLEDCDIHDIRSVMDTVADGVEKYKEQLDGIGITKKLQHHLKSDPSGSLSEDETTKKLEYRQLKIENERLECERNEQASLNKSLEDKVKELETKMRVAEEEKTSWRISRIEGAQVAVTPTYSDLCEEIRPTKIAEKYQDLYKNEWSDALEELTDKGLNEYDAIEILRNILLEADTFSQEQIEKLSDLTNYFDENIVGKKTSRQKTTLKMPPRCKILAKEILKEAATQLAGSIKMEFTKSQQSRNRNIGSATETFCQKCSEVTWYMKVLTPPVVLDKLPTQKSKINLDLYTLYSKQGETVDFVVWPACKLGEDDCLLAKGVVEPLQT